MKNIANKDVDKQAALLSYIMWSWLERNPGKTKYDSPLYYNFGFNKFQSSCPWCEINPECKTCPIYKKDKKCIFDDSIYTKWCNATRQLNMTYWFNIFKRKKCKEECKRFAKKIKEIAINDYKKLNID